MIIVWKEKKKYNNLKCGALLERGKSAGSVVSKTALDADCYVCVTPIETKKEEPEDNGSN